MKYRLVSGKFSVAGVRQEVGSVHELTSSQVEAFSDMFVPDDGQEGEAEPKTEVKKVDWDNV